MGELIGLGLARRILTTVGGPDLECTQVAENSLRTCDAALIGGYGVTICGGIISRAGSGNSHSLSWATVTGQRAQNGIRGGSGVPVQLCVIVPLMSL